MSKPKKYKGETIYDYVPDYYSTINVENPVFSKLPPGTKDARLKDVERELLEYWDILHPMVKEYLIMTIRYMNEFGEGYDHIEHLQRSLDIELSNSAELSEENRKLKSQLADLIVEKQSVDERVKDLLAEMPRSSAEEVQAMQLLIASKANISAENVHELFQNAIQQIKESEEMKKAKEDRDKMKKELDEAKAHFEKTQAEVGETFQKKIIDLQTKIDELEEELSQYRQ